MPDERWLSSRELLTRVWDIEDIRKLMSRRSYYQTAGQRERELRELWVSEPENMASASLGSNWGFYSGMDSIRRYYIDGYEAERKAAQQGLLRNGTEAACGAGLFNSRCVNTPYVILSDDGQSARGRWYMSGQDTMVCEDGSVKAWWSVWTLGVDFVREADCWKILHLVEAQDFYCPVGQNFNDEPVFPQEGRNPEQVRFGTADHSFLAHDNTYMLEDDWPPIPKNYERLNMYNSYGPEGHPGLNDRVESIAWATEVAARKAWGR